MSKTEPTTEEVQNAYLLGCDAIVLMANKLATTFGAFKKMVEPVSVGNQELTALIQFSILGSMNALAEIFENNDAFDDEVAKVTDAASKAIRKVVGEEARA